MALHELRQIPPASNFVNYQKQIHCTPSVLFHQFYHSVLAGLTILFLSIADSMAASERFDFSQGADERMRGIAERYADEAKFKDALSLAPNDTDGEVLYKRDVLVRRLFGAFAQAAKTNGDDKATIDAHIFDMTQSIMKKAGGVDASPREQWQALKAVYDDGDFSHLDTAEKRELDDLERKFSSTEHIPSTDSSVSRQTDDALLRDELYALVQKNSPESLFDVWCRKLRERFAPEFESEEMALLRKIAPDVAMAQERLHLIPAENNHEQEGDRRRVREYRPVFEKEQAILRYRKQVSRQNVWREVLAIVPMLKAKESKEIIQWALQHGGELDNTYLARLESLPIEEAEIVALLVYDIKNPITTTEPGDAMRGLGRTLAHLLFSPLETGIHALQKLFLSREEYRDIRRREQIYTLVSAPKYSSDGMANLPSFTYSFTSEQTNHESLARVSESASPVIQRNDNPHYQPSRRSSQYASFQRFVSGSPPPTEKAFLDVIAMASNVNERLVLPNDAIVSLNRMLASSRMASQRRVMKGDFLTPLSLAVQNNFVDAAMKLLEKGADPNAAICFVATPPLHQAIIYQQENLVKALLSHDANPNLMSMQGNAVHAAVQSWKAKESVLTPAITNGLIQADGTFSKSKASNLAIELHTNPALRPDDDSVSMRILRMVVEAGGRVDVANMNGNDALASTVIANRPEAFAYLLRKHPSPGSCFVSIEGVGKTPISFFLAASGNIPMLRILCEDGRSNVFGLVDGDGMTVLDYAGDAETRKELERMKNGRKTP